MKLILLAAAAVIATPVLAQTGTTASTPSGTAQTTPQTGGQTSPTDTTTTDSTAPADATAPTDTTTQTAPAPTGTTQQMPMSSAPQTTGATPAGGYQPSAPALNGTAQPGVAPRFQAAPSPDQAYPAPAPLASYPPCKAGQYDQCMQTSGSGRHHATARRRHR